MIADGSAHARMAAHEVAPHLHHLLHHLLCALRLGSQQLQRTPCTVCLPEVNTHLMQAQDKRESEAQPRHWQRDAHVALGSTRCVAQRAMQGTRISAGKTAHRLQEWSATLSANE